MIQPGSKDYNTPEAIKAAEQEFKSLTAAGHAISFSKDFASGGKLLSAHSTHYLTCTLCIERRKQNGNKGTAN